MAQAVIQRAARTRQAVTDDGFQPGESPKAGLVFVQPAQVQSGGQGDGDRQGDFQDFGQNRSNKVGRHAHQDPAHQIAHPDHPAAGPGKPLQLAGKERQYEKRCPQAQAENKENQKPNQGFPMPATQVSSPSTKGPMQGAATTPRVRPMNRLPKYPE